jgi:hypothetical protein
VQLEHLLDERAEAGGRLHAYVPVASGVAFIDQAFDKPANLAQRLVDVGCVLAAELGHVHGIPDDMILAFGSVQFYGLKLRMVIFGELGRDGCIDCPCWPKSARWRLLTGER